MSVRPAAFHVESVGVGAPLVLLHGFALHGGLFAPILPALAARARVHVVDLPGHGHSPAIVPFSLDAFAAAVDAAIPDSGQPVTVLGWSLGGQVALQWALDRPSRIAGLILVATTPSFVTRPGWPQAMAPETLARFGDELRVAWRLTLQRFLTLQVQGSDEGKAALASLRAGLLARGEPAPEVLAATLAMLASTDLRPVLPRVTAPLLVLGGERDMLVPIGATQALAAALPNASHRSIAGAAHAPFLSHPRAFADACAWFFDSRVRNHG